VPWCRRRREDIEGIPRLGKPKYANAVIVGLRKEAGRLMRLTMRSCAGEADLPLIADLIRAASPRLSAR